MAYKNKADQNAAASRWYQRNKKQQIAASAASRAKNYTLYRKIKASSKCLECGEDDVDCLTFHHRNPADKRFSLGAISSAGVGRISLLAEFNKCDCLCANCHMKLEAAIRRSKKLGKDMTVYAELPLFDAQPGE